MPVLNNKLILVLICQVIIAQHFKWKSGPILYQEHAFKEYKIVHSHLDCLSAYPLKRDHTCI